MPDTKFDRYRMTLSFALLALTLGVFAACGAVEEAHDEAADAVHGAMDHDAMEPADEAAADLADVAPRVFFANVADGDEVTSPVSLEFGIENFEIVAAQDPVVIEEGKGHHHLGVNTDCLPAGEVIVKAEPWIHFGDGSNTIDMQLPPGPARLTLQVGDGEHRTLDEASLCATIDVMVVEGEAAE